MLTLFPFAALLLAHGNALDLAAQQQLVDDTPNLLANASAAIIYLPCFDSDPAFLALKPRQRFKWVGRAGSNRSGQVVLKSGQHEPPALCMTAIAGPGTEGAVEMRPCGSSLLASQVRRASFMS